MTGRRPATPDGCFVVVAVRASGPGRTEVLVRDQRELGSRGPVPPFVLHAEREAIRRLVRTAVPGADDVTVGPASIASTRRGERVHHACVAATPSAP